MGHKQYLKVGQSAKNRLFGISPFRGGPSGGSPIQMLISEQGKINHRRLFVIVLGLFTLVMGIVLSCVPWVDYIVLKQLRLWNGSISYHYWQKPGVVRFTKIYIFNMTNPEGFLNDGEKPKLNEIGPFIYREDMEKVNVKFHDNGTVTYQHKKILQFVPELSKDKNLRFTVPNIPLLTLTSMSKDIMPLLQIGLTIFLRTQRMKPFVHVSAEELVFGYDDPITKMAHRFFPKHKRPMKQMGLLIGRNGTLNEVSSIYTGHTDMKDFGMLSQLNGLDHLPFWSNSPCSDIRASEGSFFPPRHYTKSDLTYVYDKDLCRILPLKFRYMTSKNGIEVGYYTLLESAYDVPEKNPDNQCFCPHTSEDCPYDGLQNISPCQFDAPVFISQPHFYNADSRLLDAVEGLKPDEEKHKTYFKINPKLGVPLEGQVRIQLNIKVNQVKNIAPVAKFRDIVFPIIWLQEGVADLTPAITRWIYIAATVTTTLEALANYGLIVTGLITLITVFVKTYKNIVFTEETIERGKATLRRGSSFIINGQHKLLIIRDSYTLLQNMSTDPDPDPDPEV